MVWTVRCPKQSPNSLEIRLTAGMLLAIVPIGTRRTIPPSHHITGKALAVDKPWSFKSLRVLCILLLFVSFSQGFLPTAAAGDDPGTLVFVSEDIPAIVLTVGEMPEGNSLQEYIPPPEDFLLGTAIKTASIVLDYDKTYPAPAQVRVALEYAKSIWETLLVSDVPIVIRVSWRDMGNPSILGSSRVVTYVRNFTGAPKRDTLYPIALANKLAGADLKTNEPDIEVVFNSAFQTWYLGTDGRPLSNQCDLVSVALHEFGHGLGFAGSAYYYTNSSTSSTGGWYNYPYPVIYDTFVVNGSGLNLFTSYQNNSAALGAQLVSDNLYFNGPRAVSANYGVRPRLYAPTTWQQGSSFSHLDEKTFPKGSPNALMTPVLNYGEAVHIPGPITLGLFEDLGWTAAYRLNLAPRVFLPLMANQAVSTNLGIYGTVRLNSSAAPGVTVSLAKYDANQWTDILTTTTSTTGKYAFLNAPGLTSGQSYAVRYFNTTKTSGRLYYWMTRSVTPYYAGSQVEIGNFDIGDVTLSLPTNGVRVILPDTFTWTARSAALQDSYIFHLYGPNYSPRWWTSPLGYTSSYSLSGLPPDKNDPPVLFETNTSYSWEVWIQAPDGGRGMSLEARQISFSNTGLPPTTSTVDAFDLELAARP
jgi:hypothetical protein